MTSTPLILLIQIYRWLLFVCVCVFWCTHAKGKWWIFCLITLYYCLRQDLSLTPEPTDLPLLTGWPMRYQNAPFSTSPALSITGMHWHTQLFVWVLWIWIEAPLTCVGSILTTESPLQPQEERLYCVNVIRGESQEGHCEQTTFFINMW